MLRGKWEKKRLGTPKVSGGGRGMIRGREGKILTVSSRRIDEDIIEGKNF